MSKFIKFISIFIFLLLIAWLVLRIVQTSILPTFTGTLPKQQFPTLSKEEFSEDSAYHHIMEITHILKDNKEHQDNTESDNFEIESTLLSYTIWEDSKFPLHQQWITQSANIFPHIEKALSDPNRRVPSMENDEMLSYLGSVREIVNILDAKSQKSIAAGHVEEGISQYLSTIEFASIISRGGPLINYLVEIACHSLTLSTLRKSTLLNQIPPELSRIYAYKFLEMESHWVDGEQAIMSERDFVFQVLPIDLSSMIDELGNFSLSGLGGGSLNLGEEALLKAISFGAFLLGSSEKNTRKTLSNYFDHLIYSWRSPDDFMLLYNNIARINIASEPLNLFRIQDPVGCLLIMLVHKQYKSVYEASLNRTFELRATAMLIFAHSLRAELGHWPSSEDFIAAGFKIPMDPCSDKALMFETINQDQFKIWSTGLEKTTPSSVITSYEKYYIDSLELERLRDEDDQSSGNQGASEVSTGSR